ncbi:UDP-N-acetylglucosamine 1-carboxyvinyltransferase [Labeo rohita]|uniref:UDP-N-acetylglucosamine 1-carboxyvinyltransferase n=1 Tax=Labeo rohita TaxID=84645 RepID=A0ABQ8L7Z8_LABRO|nr:UDP-N-acetylglucosamine 1-carboxyvinyltransferase [Labeo rohita]
MEMICGEYSSDMEHHLHSENVEEQSRAATWEVINSLNKSLGSDLEKEAEDDSRDLSLAAELSTWASEHQTLLHTPRQLDVKQISGMEYVYFPLTQKLQEALDSYSPDVTELHCLDLSFNIDGLPLYKSSKTCLWPVLCAVMLDPVTIFPTALTSGVSQPTDLGFLEDTVRELGYLMNHGIHYRGRKIKVNLRCFVCDAPACALVKNIKLFSGYFGCDRCEQKGEWFNRVTYQETADLKLRTDETTSSTPSWEHTSGSPPHRHGAEFSH